VREIDDLPATVWWGGAGSSIHSAHCTVHCTRAGILCSSVVQDLRYGDLGSSCFLSTESRNFLMMLAKYMSLFDEDAISKMFWTQYNISPIFAGRCLLVAILVNVPFEIRKRIFCWADGP
jgi:hypothetical protein